MPLRRKVAYIDLLSRDVVIKDIPREIRERYLGGRGLNMYLLRAHKTAGMDPFDPGNPLIVGAGLLTGLCGSRLNVSGKSPESGYLGDSNVGGYFGAELAQTGYSHLVITGKSEQPVYLSIENEKIFFRDASHLWGKMTGDTQELIRKELHDEKTRVLCIGPAGERLVRFACLITGIKNAAGRTGLGALMGSKNLKAIAVRGTKGFSVKQPKEYLALLRDTNKKAADTLWGKALGRYGTPLLFKYANFMGFTSYKYHQLTSVGDAGDDLYAENLEKNYSNGMVSCFGCPIHCRHRYKVAEGPFKGIRGEGPEYASVTSFGPTLGNLNLASTIYLSELCNKYGIDTISGGNYLGYFFTLYEKGIISKDDVGYELAWGDHDAIERLLMDTVYRRNMGDCVAEGSLAIKKLKPEAKQYLLAIKNVSIEQTDERPAKALAFGLGVATRGTCHMRSRPSVDVVGYPRDLLKDFYGGDVGKDFRDYTGKERMVWWHEIFNAVADSVGICRFAGVFSSINAIGYLDIGKLLRTAIGLDLSDKELMTIGERIYTTERLFLVDEGISRKDDHLPELYYRVPVPEGPSKGEYIDRVKYERMLDDYYVLHGWNKEGIPDKETLAELRIGEGTDEGTDENNGG